MKTIILILAILLTACEVEPVDFSVVEKQAKTGYMSFRGEIYLPDPDGKTPVPECSELTPTAITYVLEDQQGGTLSRTSAIDYQGNTFSGNPIELPIGIYTVTEVGLFNGSTLTHVIPSDEDPRFPFHEYVNKPLPYTIEISPDQTTTDNPEVMCYTATIIDLGNAEYLLEGVSYDIRTDHIWIATDACIDAISIQLIGGNEILIPVLPGNSYGIPVPLGLLYDLRAYFEGEVVLERLNTEWPIPEILSVPAIRIFNNDCN